MKKNLFASAGCLHGRAGSGAGGRPPRLAQPPARADADKRHANERLARRPARLRGGVASGRPT